jgi:hypothetical protein
VREYKGLNIPDRKQRNRNSIIEKQYNYCEKSDCHVGIQCIDCLFNFKNIDIFKEWYLSKNKKNEVKK